MSASYRFSEAGWGRKGAEGVQTADQVTKPGLAFVPGVTRQGGHRKSKLVVQGCLKLHTAARGGRKLQTGEVFI